MIVARTWRAPKCLALRGIWSFRPVVGMIADFQILDSRIGRLLYATRPMLFDTSRAARISHPRRGSVRSARVGGIKAHVGQRAALREAAEAHRDLESRRTIGATVLLRSYKLASMMRELRLRDGADLGRDHFSVLEHHQGRMPRTWIREASAWFSSH